MRPLPFALLAALTAAACADTTFTAEGYDQSCAAAEDCGAVFVGDVCGCGCEMVGLNAAVVGDAEEERAALMEGCAELLSCAPCPDPALSCEVDTCAVE